jgi:hypothetical protein
VRLLFIFRTFLVLRAACRSMPLGGPPSTGEWVNPSPSFHYQAGIASLYRTVEDVVHHIGLVLWPGQDPSEIHTNHFCRVDVTLLSIADSKSYEFVVNEIEATICTSLSTIAGRSDKMHREAMDQLLVSLSYLPYRRPRDSFEMTELACSFEPVFSRFLPDRSDEMEWQPRTMREAVVQYNALGEFCTLSCQQVNGS